ncbi:MAG: VOC family protein, partial [Microthrixaceae bacterium]|nr:VOC family protein [Microthrixaceae bacterium]
VQLPGMFDVESTIGVTHAGSGAGVSAPGTMQHLAFQVKSEDELLALRDRLRTNGIVVFGPLDHGMCRSIYFAGPEGLALEAAWSAGPMDHRMWIDPAVVEQAGISTEQLATFVDPPKFEQPDAPVPQPAIDPSKPHLDYPPEQYAAMVTVPDDVITKSGSYPDPPVRLDG